MLLTWRSEAGSLYTCTPTLLIPSLTARNEIFFSRCPELGASLRRVAQGLENVLCDLGDLLAGIYDGEDTLLLVVFFDRLGLLAIGFELSPDSLFLVVLALHERTGVKTFLWVRRRIVLEVVYHAGCQTMPPAAGYPLDQLLVTGSFEHDHPVQADPALLELLVKDTGLLNGARTGVQDP